MRSKLYLYIFNYELLLIYRNTEKAFRLLPLLINICPITCTISKIIPRLVVVVKTTPVKFYSLKKEEKNIYIRVTKVVSMMVAKERRNKLNRKIS